MIDKLDKLVKAVPGLVTAVLGILTLITGTGLGHEKWEASTQKAAGLLGVVLSIALAVLYGDADAAKKKSLVRISVAVLVVMFFLDMGADLLQAVFAKHGLEIYLLRDELWRLIYFMFCMSVILCIGCISLLMPKIGNSDHGNSSN